MAHEDIDYLLHKLIDERKEKERKEFYKYNDYPENYLGQKRDTSESEYVSQLKQALNNMVVIIPVIEDTDDGLNVKLDENKVYLFEEGSRRASTATSKLRGMVSASVTTRQLNSLLRFKTIRDGFVPTKKGQLFYVAVPLSEAVKYLIDKPT